MVPDPTTRSQKSVRPHESCVVNGTGDVLGTKQSNSIKSDIMDSLVIGATSLNLCQSTDIGDHITTQKQPIKPSQM